ncbi:hypothetical protein, partial [Xanthomonas arboricola]|uniref:hypothetical protein n=1 Tax=Xanthomonas arboricola TaxID=56448 RepID=UPI0019D6EC16
FHIPEDGMRQAWLTPRFVQRFPKDGLGPSIVPNAATVGECPQFCRWRNNIQRVLLTVISL